MIGRDVIGVVCWSCTLVRAAFQFGANKQTNIFSPARAPCIDKLSGTGKTATFTIAALQMVDLEVNRPQVLLLAPTRELAEQTFTYAERLGCHLGTVAAASEDNYPFFPYLCIGGTARAKDRQMLTHDRPGKAVPQLISGTPGRVCDLLSSRILDGRQIKFLVLDEADELLSRGFKEAIYEIFTHLNSSEVQVALVSATFPPQALDLASKFMRDPVRILVEAEKLTLDGIRQFYVDCVKEDWKFETVMDLYESFSIAQAVIFCNSRRRAEALAARMRSCDFTVGLIHAGLADGSERRVVLQEFRSGKSRVLISTDLLGRGIDVQAVSLVINFDLPMHIEEYVHRIGRSGRFGRKGVAINLLCLGGGSGGFRRTRDAAHMAEIEQFYHTQVDELPADFEDLL